MFTLGCLPTKSVVATQQESLETSSQRATIMSTSSCFKGKDTLCCHSHSQREGWQLKGILFPAWEETGEKMLIYRNVDHYGTLTFSKRIDVLLQMIFYV